MKICSLVPAPTPTMASTSAGASLLPSSQTPHRMSVTHIMIRVTVRKIREYSLFEFISYFCYIISCPSLYVSTSTSYEHILHTIVLRLVHKSSSSMKCTPQQSPPLSACSDVLFLDIICAMTKTNNLNVSCQAHNYPLFGNWVKTYHPRNFEERSTLEISAIRMREVERHELYV
jgi:hypothetical protein